MYLHSFLNLNVNLSLKNSILFCHLPLLIPQTHDIISLYRQHPVQNIIPTSKIVICKPVEVPKVLKLIIIFLRITWIQKPQLFHYPIRVTIISKYGDFRHKHPCHHPNNQCYNYKYNKAKQNYHTPCIVFLHQLVRDIHSKRNS